LRTVNITRDVLLAAHRAYYTEGDGTVDELVAEVTAGVAISKLTQAVTAALAAWEAYQAAERDLPPLVEGDPRPTAERAYDQGYRHGYRAGKDIGYERGYQEGRALGY
jgi:hypothetical protein